MESQKTRQLTEEEYRQRLVKYTAKAFREARKNQMHGGGNWIDRAAEDVVNKLFELSHELEAEYDAREAAIAKENQDNAKPGTETKKAN